MKTLTKEALKIGSIWKYGGEIRCVVKILSVSDDQVCYQVIDADRKDSIGNKIYWYIGHFLRGFEPVYIIEGFEV